MHKQTQRHYSREKMSHSDIFGIKCSTFNNGNDGSVNNYTKKLLERMMQTFRMKMG